MPETAPGDDQQPPRATRGPDLPSYTPALLAASAFVLPAVGLFTPGGTAVLLLFFVLPALLERDIRVVALRAFRGRFALLLGLLLAWGGITAIWSPPMVTLCAGLRACSVYWAGARERQWPTRSASR